MNEETGQLPETARNALIQIAEELRAGFTGRFEVHCIEGGVRRLREERDYSGDDLRDEKQSSV